MSGSESSGSAHDPERRDPDDARPGPRARSGPSSTTVAKAKKVDLVFSGARVDGRDVECAVLA